MAWSWQIFSLSLRVEDWFRLRVHMKVLQHCDCWMTALEAGSTTPLPNGKAASPKEQMKSNKQDEIGYLDISRITSYLSLQVAIILRDRSLLEVREFRRLSFPKPRYCLTLLLEVVKIWQSRTDLHSNATQAGSNRTLNSFCSILRVLEIQRFSSPHH